MAMRATDARKIASCIIFVVTEARRSGRPLQRLDPFGFKPLIAKNALRA
jgi:hypothetical protein